MKDSLWSHKINLKYHLSKKYEKQRIIRLYVDNLAYFTITKWVPETEMIDLLYKRGYVDFIAINNKTKQVGDVILLNIIKLLVLRMYMISQLEDKIIKKNMKICIKLIKSLATINNSKTIGIIQDIAILNINSWHYFIKQFEKICDPMYDSSLWDTNHA